MTHVTCVRFSLKMYRFELEYVYFNYINVISMFKMRSPSVRGEFVEILPKHCQQDYY